MERSIFKELNKKNLEIYLGARTFQEVYFPMFFPIKQTGRLDFETLIGQANARVIGDIVSYDSKAPLKSRQVISKLTGEIPAIRVARKMSERDINEYNTLSSMATPNEKAILDLVFGDVDFVFEAIQGKLEWMALTALSTGAMSLTVANNPGGIVTETNIDFAVPTANKTGVVDEWDQVATATPIVDIQAVQTLATAAGHQLKYMLMTPAKFNQMRATTEVKSLIATYLLAGSAVTGSPNLDNVNRYLSAEGLPTIVLINQSLGIESAAGVVTYANPWSAHVVTFLPDYLCGNMLSGPLASATNPPVQEIQAMRGSILIAKYRNVDPVSEITRGEINAFPSWGNVDRTYLLNTNHVSTWS